MTIKETAAALVLTAIGLSFSFAGELRIEPENFADHGKWQIREHIGASNGAMLFGGEAGEENAIREVFTVPPGKYTIWVRSLSWGERYRQSVVFANGVRGVFGDMALQQKSKDALPVFGWERFSKTVDAPKGKLELKLHPKSNLVRIDVIVISDDEKYAPPDDREELEKIPEATVRSGSSKK